VISKGRFSAMAYIEPGRPRSTKVYVKRYNTIGKPKTV